MTAVDGDAKNISEENTSDTEADPVGPEAAADLEAPEAEVVDKSQPEEGETAQLADCVTWL